MSARWGEVPRQRQGPDRTGAGLGVEVAGPDPRSRSAVETEVQRWSQRPTGGDDLPRSRSGRRDRVRDQVRAVVATACLWAREALDPGPVKRADRARWAGASSLAELGELTAQWLTGQIVSQPGYHGPVDVDEDLAPGLTTALVSLCRAGAFPQVSQAGYDGPDPSGYLTQVAWVGAFMPAQVHEVLVRAARGTPYRVVVHSSGSEVVTVTWTDGEPSTSCGWTNPRGMERAYRDSIGPRAWQDLQTASQVSIIDPRPGRNTLWAWLQEAVAGLGGPA